MDGWRGARFDHGQFTGFPLGGAHAQIACTTCHVGGRFTGTASTCFDCHAKDFAAAKSPDHVQAGFPKECQSFHTDLSRQGARFDHNAATRFPLVGAHVNLACTSCHLSGQFFGTATN